MRFLLNDVVMIVIYIYIYIYIYIFITKYLAEAITDRYYTDDFAFLANSPVSAESLLHSLSKQQELLASYVNANITGFMCFQQGVICTLGGKPLITVDQFTYLGRRISSAEIDVNIRIGKSRTIIKKLSIRRKSNISNEIKRDLF